MSTFESSIGPYKFTFAINPKDIFLPQITKAIPKINLKLNTTHKSPLLPPQHLRLQQLVANAIKINPIDKTLTPLSLIRFHLETLIFMWPSFAISLVPIHIMRADIKSTNHHTTKNNIVNLPNRERIIPYRMNGEIA